MSFIFGGDTGQSYDDMQRKRQVAQALLVANSRTPQDAGEGLHAIGRAIRARKLTTQANEAETEGRAQANEMFNSAMGMAGAPASYSPFELPAPQEQQAGASAPVQSAPFGGTQAEYIEAMWPHALEASRQTGVDPRIIVAQASLETGYGQHVPGNNHFGIKSHGQDGGNSLMTTEVVDGQPVRIRDSFRAYGGMGESAQGYADFLRANPRYGDLMGAQGLDAQLDALQASGYATDPEYAAKLRSIIGRIPGGIGVAPSAPAQPETGTVSARGQSPGQMGALYQALGNPFLNDGQKAMIQQQIQQMQQAADPMRQLQMQQMQMEIARAGQPGPRQMIEGADGYQYYADSGERVLPGVEAPAEVTDRMQNYEFAIQQGMTPEQAQRFAGAGGGVTVNTGSEIGPISKDHEMVIDPETGGRSLRPIPGGSADTSSDDAYDAASAQASISLIDAVLNDENLGAVTGMIQGRLPARTQSQQDLMVRIEQLQGQAFLQAFETLKGGGQITEREGQAAQAAMARLQRVQSEAAYREALQELRDIVARGMQRGSATQGPPPSQPAPPEVSQSGGMSRQEFFANPAMQRAAEGAGVTVEDMWRAYQETNQ